MKFLDWLGGVIAAARAKADSLVVGSAMATVSFCSGFISYTHICALTLREGGSWKVAHLYPFCIDGQLVIGSWYLMGGKTWKSKTAGAVLGVVPGIGESLYANWQSGVAHGYWSAGWATVPAQAFACSTILFERWLHRRREEMREAGLLRSAAEAALDEALARVEALTGQLATAQAWSCEQQLVIEKLQAARAARRRVTAPPPPAEGGQAAGAVNPPPAPELPPLPEGEELRLLLATCSGNEIARRYDVTRWTAQKMVNEFKAGTLDFGGEVTEEVSGDGEGAGRAA